MLELRPNCELCDRDLPPELAGRADLHVRVHVLRGLRRERPARRVPQLRRQLRGPSRPAQAVVAGRDWPRPRSGRNAAAPHVVHPRGDRGVRREPSRRAGERAVADPRETRISAMAECRLIRGGAGFRGKQGLDYFSGVSAESTGAQGDLHAPARDAARVRAPIRTTTRTTRPRSSCSRARARCATGRSSRRS